MAEIMSACWRYVTSTSSLVIGYVLKLLQSTIGVIIQLVTRRKLTAQRDCHNIHNNNNNNNNLLLETNARSEETKALGSNDSREQQLAGGSCEATNRQPNNKQKVALLCEDMQLDIEKASTCTKSSQELAIHEVEQQTIKNKVGEDMEISNSCQLEGGVINKQLVTSNDLQQAAAAAALQAVETHEQLHDEIKQQQQQQQQQQTTTNKDYHTLCNSSTRLNNATSAKLAVAVLPPPPSATLVSGQEERCKSEQQQQQQQQVVVRSKEEEADKFSKLQIDSSNKVDCGQVEAIATATAKSSGSSSSNKLVEKENEEERLNILASSSTDTPVASVGEYDDAIISTTATSVAVVNCRENNNNNNTEQQQQLERDQMHNKTPHKAFSVISNMDSSTATTTPTKSIVIEINNTTNGSGDTNKNQAQAVEIISGDTGDRIREEEEEEVEKDDQTNKNNDINNQSTCGFDQAERITDSSHVSSNTWPESLVTSSQRLADNILAEVRQQINNTTIHTANAITMTDLQRQGSSSTEDEEVEATSNQLHHHHSDEYPKELAQSNHKADATGPEVSDSSNGGQRECRAKEEQPKEEEGERKIENNFGVCATSVQLDDGIVCGQSGQINELSEIEMKKQSDDDDDDDDNDCQCLQQDANFSTANPSSCDLATINSETISFSEEQQLSSSIPSETTPTTAAMNCNNKLQQTAATAMATSKTQDDDDVTDNYEVGATPAASSTTICSNPMQELPIEGTLAEELLPPSSYSNDTDREGINQQQQDNSTTSILEVGKTDKTISTNQVLQLCVSSGTHNNNISNNNNDNNIIIAEIASGEEEPQASSCQIVMKESSSVSANKQTANQVESDNDNDDDAGGSGTNDATTCNKTIPIHDPLLKQDNNDEIMIMTSCANSAAADINEPEYFLEKDAASGAVLQRLKAEAIEDLSVCKEQKMALKAARELFAQFDARGQAPILVQANKRQTGDSSFSTDSQRSSSGGRSTSPTNCCSSSVASSECSQIDSDLIKTSDNDQQQQQLDYPRRSPTSVSRSTLVYSNVQSVSPDGSCVSGKVDLGDFDRTTPLYPIESDEIKSCQDAFRNFKKIFQEGEQPTNEQIVNQSINADGINNNNNIIACSNKSKLFQSDKAQMNCHKCQQKVYPMDKLELDFTKNTIHVHKNCFRCHTCSSLLRLETYSSIDSKLYCPSHVKNHISQQSNNNNTIQAHNQESIRN